jgi:chromate reductase, NAD(P)H dehydrogenase (quinone)
MTDTPRILALAGSTREGSYNRRLLATAIRGASAAGAEVTLIDLRDYALPLYDGDLEAREGLPAAAQQLKDLLAAHQGLLIASPENNGSISAVLKNAIDWASRPAPRVNGREGFRGKVVALLSASTGRWGGVRGLAHVRSILAVVGCLVLADTISIPYAAKAFTEAGDLADPKESARAEALGATLARTIARLHSE